MKCFLRPTFQNSLFLAQDVCHILEEYGDESTEVLIEPSLTLPAVRWSRKSDYAQLDSHSYGSNLAADIFAMPRNYFMFNGLEFNGGEGGIRTPDSLATMSDFESGAFNRALPPLRNIYLTILSTDNGPSSVLS